MAYSQPQLLLLTSADCLPLRRRLVKGSSLILPPRQLQPSTDFRHGQSLVRLSPYIMHPLGSIGEDPNVCSIRPVSPSHIWLGCRISQDYGDTCACYEWFRHHCYSDPIANFSISKGLERERTQPWYV
jgi:hypothetical protein